MVESKFLCKRCNKPLYIMEKFTPWSYGAGTSTVRETLTLQAGPKMEFWKEISKGTTISPDIFVCNECGSVEYILSKKALRRIQEIEEDIRYINRVRVTAY